MSPGFAITVSGLNTSVLFVLPTLTTHTVTPPVVVPVVAVDVEPNVELVRLPPSPWSVEDVAAPTAP